MKSRIVLALCCMALSVPLNAATLFIADWDDGLNANFAAGSPTGTVTANASQIAAHGVPQLTDSTGYLNTTGPNGSLSYSALNNITSGATALTSGTIQFWMAPNIADWGSSGSAISQIFFTDTSTDRINIVKAAGTSELSVQFIADSALTTMSSNSINTANGAWNYIAFSWTPTELNLQVNGASLQTVSISNTLENPFGAFYLGGIFGQSGNVSFDNFRISDVALSASELLAGYSATTEFAAIPEPKGWVLAALGVISLVPLRFLKRRKI